jgi:hypothetical protein
MLYFIFALFFIMLILENYSVTGVVRLNDGSKDYGYGC